MKQFFKLEKFPLSNNLVILDIVEIPPIPPNISFQYVEFIYFVCSSMLCCLESDFSFTVLLTYGRFIVKLQLVWTSMPAYHDINLWSVQSFNNSLIIQGNSWAFSLWGFSDISLKQFTLKRIQWLQHIVIYIYIYMPQSDGSSLIIDKKKKTK